MAATISGIHGAKKDLADYGVRAAGGVPFPGTPSRNETCIATSCCPAANEVLQRLGFRSHWEELDEHDARQALGEQ
jgi:hypothetical protein